MNIIESPRCNFCYLESQTFNHQFLDCIEVKNFWFRIEDFINKTYSQGLKLSDREKLFGIRKKSANKIIINNLLISAKYYIHSCRVTAKPLNSIIFLQCLNDEDF